MIDEIRKRLDSGEKVELECIDEHGFLYDLGGADFRSNSEMLSRGGFTVDCIDCDGDVYIEQGSFILGSELKYFKIKDSGSTFNDLIDVAVQAYKDGVVSSLSVGFDMGMRRVKLDFDEGTHSYYESGDIEEHIYHVKSLYYETFTIESEEDELRIKRPVKSILLANGVEIIDEEKLMLLSAGLHLDGGAVGGIKIPFSFLKGATVTQQRN